MFALSKLFTRLTGYTFGLALAVLLVSAFTLPQPAQAVGSCSFACITRPTSDNSCTTDPSDSASCPNYCRRVCEGLGMRVTQGSSSTCTDRTTAGGALHCTPCTCTPQLVLRCEGDARRDAGDNPGLGGECPTQCQNICDTNRYTDRIRGVQVASVACRTSPSAQCIDAALVTGQLGICQQCVRTCIDRAATIGTVGTPTDCYNSCQTLENFEGGQNAPCRGINQEQATQPFNASGAVSGSSGRRSNLQSSTATANEAATLPPGACAQRALAANPEAEGRISQIEIAFEVPRAQWTCRRVCSTPDEATCVSGGCPGSADIKCCTPATGSPPANLCGGRGAATEGAAAGGQAPAPGTGGTTDGGASGSSSGGAGTGGGSGSGSTGSSGSGNTSVGATNVAADSGGLTRLILPACIEDGGCQLSDIVQVALNAIRFLFGLAGILLLVVFVYAGVEYLIAGDAASVKSAESRIKNALIGLFLMFFGYTLVNFLVGLFINA